MTFLSDLLLVALNIKGCICHLAKWQIHPFIAKATICVLAGSAGQREAYKDGEMNQMRSRNRILDLNPGYLSVTPEAPISNFFRFIENDFRSLSNC